MLLFTQYTIIIYIFILFKDFLLKMNLKHNQTYAAKTRKQKDLLSGTGNDQ